MSILIGSLSARPMGKATDGTRVDIVGFGFTIKPPAGMMSYSKGVNEALNYCFPWFQGKNGFLNFAVVLQSDPKQTLLKSFESHLKKMRGDIKFTGKFEVLQLKSGIKSIRAEFDGKGGTRIVRYYLLNPKRQLRYVHIMLVDPKNKSLDAAVVDTLKQA